MKKAFTLMEILIVLAITSILTLLIVNYVPKNLAKTDSLLYTSANTLAHDVATDIANGGGNLTDGTFCANFLSRVNTIGSTNCTYSSIPDSPNFVTTNGMRWYGLEAAANATTFTLNFQVDVNGVKKGNNYYAAGAPPDPACGTVTIGAIKVSLCNNTHNLVANNDNPGTSGCWQGLNTLCSGTGCSRSICNYQGAVDACTDLNGGVNYSPNQWRLPTNAELDTIGAAGTADLCNFDSGYSPYCNHYTGGVCTGAASGYCQPHVVWSAASSVGNYAFYYLNGVSWIGPSTSTTSPAWSARCVRSLNTTTSPAADILAVSVSSNTTTAATTPPDPTCPGYASGAVTIGAIKVSQCNNTHNLVANGNSTYAATSGCWQGLNTTCTGTGCGTSPDYKATCNHQGAIDACTDLNGGVTYSNPWRLPTNSELSSLRTTPGSTSPLTTAAQGLDICDYSSSSSCPNYVGCAGSSASTCQPSRVWSATNSTGSIFDFYYLSGGSWLGPVNYDNSIALSVRCVRSL